MYNFKCAGQLVEVEGYQFRAGYALFDWIHSSDAPHVWVQASGCKLISAATPQSRALALEQLDQVSVKRGFPHNIQVTLKELLTNKS